MLLNNIFMRINKYQTGYVSTTGYSSNDISCGPVVSLVDCSLFFKGICEYVMIFMKNMLLYFLTKEEKRKSVY